MILLGLDDVNVMMCFDYGMIFIKEIFDIEDIIDYEDIIVLILEGVIVKIWLKDGVLDKVIFLD